MGIVYSEKVHARFVGGYKDLFYFEKFHCSQDMEECRGMGD